jgi:hypothetical protein
LGDGSKIRFLDDVWCREMALREAFSELYSIACVKEALVAVNLDLSSGSHKWDVSFIRAAHDWEMDVLASIFNLLYSNRMRREGEDKLWWAHSNKGMLDVGSFYRVLACHDGIHFPCKSNGGPRC